MAPGRGPCSDTTKTELLCQWIKTMATYFFEMIVRGSNELDGRKDEEDFVSFGSTTE